MARSSLGRHAAAVGDLQQALSIEGEKRQAVRREGAERQAVRERVMDEGGRSRETGAGTADGGKGVGSAEERRIEAELSAAMERVRLEGGGGKALRESRVSGASDSEAGALDAARDARGGSVDSSLLPGDARDDDGREAAQVLSGMGGGAGGLSGAVEVREAGEGRGGEAGSRVMQGRGVFVRSRVARGTAEERRPADGKETSTAGGELPSRAVVAMEEAYAAVRMGGRKGWGERRSYDPSAPMTRP